MYLHYLILLLLGTVSCRHTSELKKQEIAVTPFCTEVAGDVECSYQWSAAPSAFGNEVLPDTHPETVHYSRPSINPNNPEQFVCFKQNHSHPQKCSIIIYDMRTETEKVLFSFQRIMEGSLTWGKKDWIAFTQGAGTIRIFKSDGSKDHEIVARSGMIPFLKTGPAWSPDGSSLYYHTSGGTSTSSGIICDTNGIILSELKSIIKPNWNSDGVIIGAEGWQIFTLNPSTNERNIIAEWPRGDEGVFADFIAWLPDRRHAVFSKKTGLYRVDTQSGEIVQMKDRCVTKKYQALSVSNEGNFILCEKIIGKQTGDHTAVERSEIWKMDINGCNEARVLPK